MNSVRRMHINPPDSAGDLILKAARTDDIVLRKHIVAENPARLAAADLGRIMTDPCVLIPWNLLAEKLIQKIFRLPDTLLADAGQILRFRAVAIQDMGHIDGNLIGSRAMRHKLKHAVVDRHRRGLLCQILRTSI